MARVIRVLLLLFAIALCFPACSEPEKQWYKPGVDYTVTDFQRDRAACEKGGKLDEDCLRERGWRPLSADKAPPTPPPSMPDRKSVV